MTASRGCSGAEGFPNKGEMVRMDEASVETLFGELRSILQGATQVLFEEIVGILLEAHAKHPDRYVQEWLPYLEKAPIAPHTFRSIEELLERAPLLPFPGRHNLEVVNEDLEEFDRLQDASELRVLSSLSIQSSLSDYPDFLTIKLLTQPSLAHLKSLALPHNTLPPDVIVALGKTPHLSNLESLDLWDNFSGRDGVRALADSPHLDKLTALELAWNELEDHHIDVLANRRGLPNLQTLSLTENPIEDAGLRALARNESSRTLVELELSYTQCTRFGIAALGRSENLDNLKRLEVGNNGSVDLDAVSKLLEGSPNRRLTHLDLTGLGVGDDIAEFIAKTPVAKHLEVLVLDYHRLTSEGIQALARSMYLKNLDLLSLSTVTTHVGISQTSVEELVARFANTQVLLPHPFSQRLTSQQ